MSATVLDFAVELLRELLDPTTTEPRKVEIARLRAELRNRAAK